MIFMLMAYCPISKQSLLYLPARFKISGHIFYILSQSAFIIVSHLFLNKICWQLNCVDFYRTSSYLYHCIFNLIFNSFSLLNLIISPWQSWSSMSTWEIREQVWKVFPKHNSKSSAQARAQLWWFPSTQPAFISCRIPGMIIIFPVFTTKPSFQCLLQNS